MSLLFIQVENRKVKSLLPIPFQLAFPYMTIKHPKLPIQIQSLLNCLPIIFRVASLSVAGTSRFFLQYLSNVQVQSIEKNTQENQRVGKPKGGKLFRDSHFPPLFAMQLLWESEI